ncbi:hypothetical protein HID58_095690 [Brassica napus]|uniref:SBP-type domain-containing protein n=1 Tax=Brassica napus TaxID=3708 RepID=A0ABQ7X570_BRANA|nr:hypothetical protein HID58_095690 [Brassica napus]
MEGKKSTRTRVSEKEGSYLRERRKRKGVMDRFKGSSSNRVSSRLCQVDRCTTDLKEAKQYHRRHKVCEVHAKASSVYLAGVKQRFWAGGRRGVTSQVMQNQERSRVEMTLPIKECELSKSTRD